MLQLYTEQEMLSRLAEMFEKERIAQDITQKELSSRAGIPLPTYRVFLKNGTLSAKNMFKLLFVLQLDEKGTPKYNLGIIAWHIIWMIFQIRLKIIYGQTAALQYFFTTLNLIIKSIGGLLI